MQRGHLTCENQWTVKIFQQQKIQLNLFCSLWECAMCGPGFERRKKVDRPHGCLSWKLCWSDTLLTVLQFSAELSAECTWVLLWLAIKQRRMRMSWISGWVVQVTRKECHSHRCWLGCTLSKSQSRGPHVQVQVHEQWTCTSHQSRGPQVQVQAQVQVQVTREECHRCKYKHRYKSLEKSATGARTTSTGTSTSH